MVEPQHIVEQVTAALGEGTHIDLLALTGTRDHYKAVSVSPAFEGALPIKRHRLVYAALAEELFLLNDTATTEIYTPAEWDALG